MKTVRINEVLNKEDFNELITGIKNIAQDAIERSESWLGDTGTITTTFTHDDKFYCTVLDVLVGELQSIKGNLRVYEVGENVYNAIKSDAIANGSLFK